MKSVTVVTNGSKVTEQVTVKSRKLISRNLNQFGDPQPQFGILDPHRGGAGAPHVPPPKTLKKLNHKNAIKHKNRGHWPSQIFSQL